MSKGRARFAPLIGITCLAEPRRPDFSDYELICDHRYAAAVKDAGGHPVLLPIAHRRQVMARYLEGIDGLVIVGGDDVDPRLYGQAPIAKTKLVYGRRTEFERWLYKTGKRRRLPIFGVCYGMQLINVLEGGTLRQHLYPKRRGPRIEHVGKREETHPVDIVAGTRFASIVGVRRAQVVTGHHQAVRDLAPGFVVAARAADGVIEAIECPDHPQIIAVQWHPEQMLGSRSTRRLFAAFKKECDRYQVGKIRS